MFSKWVGCCHSACKGLEILTTGTLLNGGSSSKPKTYLLISLKYVIIGMKVWSSQSLWERFSLCPRVEGLDSPWGAVDGYCLWEPRPPDCGWGTRGCVHIAPQWECRGAGAQRAGRKADCRARDEDMAGETAEEEVWACGTIKESYVVVKPIM